MGGVHQPSATEHDRVSAPSELALWTRGRDGDGAAFGLIFDLHRDRVFRHAYRLLQDRHDAEDAAAVAFLELWRRRSSVRLVEDSVLAWLLVTAGNAARNLDRSRRRYRHLLNVLPHAADLPSAEDQALTAGADADDLAAAIRQLPPSDARLFALVALEEYSVVDAARLLGLTAGAARTRLHRIKSRLRDHLGYETRAAYLTGDRTTTEAS